MQLALPLLAVNGLLIVGVFLAPVYQGYGLVQSFISKDADEDYFGMSINYYIVSIVIDLFIAVYLIYILPYIIKSHNRVISKCRFLGMSVICTIVIILVIGIFVYGIIDKHNGFGIYVLNNTARIENEKEVCYQSCSCMILTK